MTSADKTPTTGVLLYNLGAPETLGDIEPFLTNLFGDPVILPIKPGFLRRFVARRLAKSRAKKVAPRYRAIGGSSPLLEITKRQAAALETRLAGRGIRARVLVGMRYSTPTLAEALSGPDVRELERLVLMPLYPQYSMTTTGSALAEIERIKLLYPFFPQTLSIKHWHDHPAYLDAAAARLREEIEKFSPKARENLHVVFSAHSIPEKFVRAGDPYPDHVRRTVEGVLERAPADNWRLAYQSRVGPVRWLRPSTTEVLDSLCARGAGGILVAPVSFVSDHLETLYEIDIEMRGRVQSSGGAEFRRAASLNAEPDFIEALAGIVNEKLENSGNQTHPQT